MGTASLGVHDSGVVLLSGESGVALPLSSGTASRGRDCACSAALRAREANVSRHASSVENLHILVACKTHSRDGTC